MIYLDTHVLIWLYEGLLNKFPAKAFQQLENNKLLISPMVQLELEYLYEIKRIACQANEILNELIVKLGLAFSDESFKQVIYKATQLNWTRDPFDRIIVATAALEDSPLLTKDSKINNHYPYAIWQ